MIFKEIGGFEADLNFVDGKWTGKITSVGPFWSNPARNPDGKMKEGADIEFILRGPVWIQSNPNLPWFILDPDKRIIDHYR